VSYLLFFLFIYPNLSDFKINRYLIYEFKSRPDPVKELLAKGPGLKLPECARFSGYFTALSLGSIAVTLMIPDGRRKLKKRWEVFTSPNHANPLNQGPFHFRRYDEEKNQVSQGDKGVHFLTAYALVNPLSLFFEYFYQIIGINEPVGYVTERAYWTAVFADFLFGFSEEYVDAFEKDEGFSIYDLMANIAGLGFSILKKYGYLSSIDFFWAIHRPPSTWKYHFWLNMPSYEFTIRIDLSPYLFGEKADWETFKWWRRYIAYVGSVRFFMQNMYKHGPEWRRVER